MYERSERKPPYHLLEKLADSLDMKIEEILKEVDENVNSTPNTTRVRSSQEVIDRFKLLKSQSNVTNEELATLTSVPLGEIQKYEYTGKGLASKEKQMFVEFFETNINYFEAKGNADPFPSSKNIYKHLGSKLRHIRKLFKKTQAEVADILNLDVSSIEKIESAKELISMRSLIIFAKFFGESLDYLTGRATNSLTKYDRISFQFIPHSRDYFQKIYSDFIDEKNAASDLLTRIKFELGKDKHATEKFKTFIAKETSADFDLNKSSYPSVEVIVKIADYIEVDLDYLLGFTDAQKIEIINFDLFKILNDRKINLEYKNSLLTEEDRNDIKQVIEILVNRK